MICENCKKQINIRTEKQNRALHLLFTQVADFLNEIGFEMNILLPILRRGGVDISWTGDTVKAYLWKPIQKYYLQTQSTKRLKTGEIDKVFDILNRVLSQEIGESLPPFPSIETLYENSISKSKR